MAAALRSELCEPKVPVAGEGWRALWSIGALAVLVRLAHVWAIRDVPLFEHLVGDGQAYDAWARRIAAGDWLGGGVFYQAPLYPYFLAGIFTCFGHTLAAVRVIQAVLGALGCVLLGVAGSRFFSARVGCIAAAGLALWPSAIFADALIQKSNLDTVLFCGLLAVLAQGMRGAVARTWLAVGCILGGLVLTRENALAFIPVVLGALVLHFRKTAWAPARARAAAAFLLGLALVLLPVAARNRLVGGEWHLTTAQFGPNFFIGNNPAATGLYHPLLPDRGDPEFEQHDATELAEHAAGHALAPGAVSRYWTGQAWAFISRQPGRWLTLLTRKTVLLLNRVEVGDAEDQYTYSDWSRILAVLGPLLNFGLLVPVAAAGVVLTWARRRRLGVLLALLGVYALTVIATYVMARYRYPLVPLLLLFASAGVVEAIGSVQARQWQRLAIAASVALCAAIPANWPIISEASVRAVTVYNLGNVFWAEGRVTEAIAQYAAAARLQPASAGVRNNLGLALARQGKIAEAIAQYREALRLNPDDPETRSNFAGALAAQGRLEEAIAQYAEALRLRPAYAEAHNNLAIALAEQGKIDQAIAHFEQAVRLQPTYAAAHKNLAIALADQGKLDQAVTHYSAALELDPNDAQTRDALAALRAAGAAGTGQ